MLTLTPTCIPNFYSVPSSNGYDHYPLLVEAGNKITCGCPGFNRWGHCYHALEASKQVTYQPDPEEIHSIPVPETEGKEVTCSYCGAWMMAWAWPVHLRGNFCEMYLSEKRVAPATPAPAKVEDFNILSSAA